MGARGWRSARLGFVVCGYLAFVCGGLVRPAEAGCGQRESPSCCTGRNNECFEYSRRKTVCYCDAYCQKTRDCCEDYQRVCQVSGELIDPLLCALAASGLGQGVDVFLHVRPLKAFKPKCAA